MSMVECRTSVQREGVYRWFSFLTSAQRAEFLCGLLDLCVPIELRFLGSCLEDLARKDYHSLRDAEIKANNPADLSGLTNITDEVVRSKLLVSLALLGSDNREAAGVLFRTLTHIDTVINNYGLALNDGGADEQFLLLFTMASHHPAFSFHQKQALRQQLSQLRDILQVSSEGARGAEASAAGPNNDKAAICYNQLHHHGHDKPASLPLASLPPTACSLPDPISSYLPLPVSQSCHIHCSCWHKRHDREAETVAVLGSGVTTGRQDQVVSQDLISPPNDPPSSLLPHLQPPHSHLSSPLPAGQSLDSAAPTKTHLGKAGKVVIEGVVLRGVAHKSEDISEYVFEARWSDGLVSSIVRTQEEITELLSQLSKAFPDEGLEKYLPQSTELDPRCLTSLPCHVLQHQNFQLFFTSTRPVSPNSPPSLSSSCIPPLPSSPPTAPVAPTYPFTTSSNLGCMVQHRGTNRAIYRVASVQPVISNHSSVMTRPSPHMSSLPPSLPPALPPFHHSPQLSLLPAAVPTLPTQGSIACGGDSSSPQTHGQSHSYSQHLPTQTSSQSCALPQSIYLPHSHSVSHSHSQSHSQSRSQSNIQVPSQSQPNTPEQSGIHDWLRRLRLHKYYPVFKQLTMEEFLALTEEDLNKYDLTQGAKKKLKTQLELQKSAEEIKMEKRSCSSIARVTPSSHIGHSTISISTAVELQVDVDAMSHHQPVSKDSSSSSGYSSSSCSPRTPLCCDSPYDRTRDIHRRVSGPDTTGVGPEKDRSCLLVLPSSCPSGISRPTAQVLPVQTDPTTSLPPSCSLSLPQSPYHPQANYPQTLLSTVPNPARILTSPRKPRPLPLCNEERTKPIGSGHLATNANFSKGLSMGIGVRLEKMDGSTTIQDSVNCCEKAGGAMGLMVETSSALTSTSNSLHHVSHPPLHFHLSSSSSPSSSGYYSYPPTSPASSSFSSFLSSSCPSTKSGSLSSSPGSGGGFIPIATANSIPVHPVPCNTYYLSQPTSSSSSSSCSGSSLDQSPGHNMSMCVCSSCGCRGNCSAYGMLPGYAVADHLQSFSACPSLFTLGPLLHFSPLVASSSASGTGAPFSYPMMIPPPLYCNSPISHDQQLGFAFYQSHSFGNGSQKRPSMNLSCYNCGANGHRAEECKQPSMESGPQGTFRLNYSPHTDPKDSGE
ncbi:zinc finger CCHC domain-containing protein 14 isoform X2 [Cheilinus undulatus]|uniref:zinc finger CCHC domain-containing protein 14 isoform X2 n=1 Tax=Cheilinus undulatus TaxID=241271 RepID=UPI001BD49047|nr:zinc finger CCHC domain-containing protein 14 isoform X2 [Cheilinus undulatus]